MAPQYGLGALPSPFSPTDYPISIALAEAPVLAVPKAYAISPVPPNLNQGSLPYCVAYATSGQRMYQQRLEHTEWRDFDETWLYRRCKEHDGIPNVPGTYLRTALSVARTIGVRTVGHADEANNKIAAFYRVPPTRASLREVLIRRGPVVASLTWFDSWFDTPKDGNLPRPSGRTYGHAVVATGYDNAHVNVDGTKGAVLFRNSWSRKWGSLGNFWMPYAWFERYAFEAWWAQDKKDQ